MKFYQMFLIAAWVIFFASGRTPASSVLLILSGAYAVIEIIPKLRKKR